MLRPRDCAITINGQRYQLSLDPRVTLLDLLRERLHLVGTKKGCDHGQCGACTVLAGGVRINSCLSLALTHDGESITTIEGLEQNGELHPLQAAFIEYDGFQCGYCTSGQICSAAGLLNEVRGRSTPLSDSEIRERIRPSTVDGAIAAVSQSGAKFLGGGSNLIDLMKMGVEQPASLIDITRLPLSRIEEYKGGLRIGATARNSVVAEHPLVREKYPLLSEALLAGASPQLRNMATVGGNLMQRTRCYYFYGPTYSQCNKRFPGSGCAAVAGYNRIHAILGANAANPRGQAVWCIATNPGDMGVALMALDAVVAVRGPLGDRAIPIADFYRTPGDAPNLDTNLRSGKLIVAVDLPLLDWATGVHYLKIRDRNSYAFALVSVAAVGLDGNGAIRQSRIAFGRRGSHAWRVPEAEHALIGQMPGAAPFRAAADTLLRSPTTYPHNAFKVELARRAIARALTTTTSA